MLAEGGCGVKAADMVPGFLKLALAYFVAAPVSGALRERTQNERVNPILPQGNVPELPSSRLHTYMQVLLALLVPGNTSPQERRTRECGAQTTVAPCYRQALPRM